MAQRDEWGDDPVQILQIWVFPRKNGTPPRYQDYDIRPLQKKNEPYTIVAPDGSTPASLLQDCWFSLLDLEAARDVVYTLHDPAHGVYLFLIEGMVEAGGFLLNRRDGLGISNTPDFKVTAQTDSLVLLIEVPMH